MKKIFWLIFFPVLAFSYQYELSICSMFQNEARFLKEWIDYHRNLGVQHFWLYNNNSTDNYKDVLKPYIREGIVELIEWPSVKHENDYKHHTYKVQILAFNHAIKRAKRTSQWLAIIDTDEFITPLNNKSIPEILRNHFSLFGGVAINWEMYGTSNQYEVQSVVNELTRHASLNHPLHGSYKSIVMPQRVTKCTNPHFCVMQRGFPVVTMGKKVAKHGQDGPHYRHMKLRHYWTRDEKYYNEVKIPRYLSWGFDASWPEQRKEEFNELP